MTRVRDVKAGLSFLAVWIVVVDAFNTHGVVLPNNPYVFIGQDLTITCNLTSPLPETSDSLFFTKEDIVMPKQYIQTLSSRSIQLTLPVISPDDAGNYICKLNRAGGYPSVIGNQLVTVEYKPKAVESVKCMVYNWESMTCSWDLGVNYIHLEDIKVQLVWTRADNSQHDCPHLTVNSCTWKREEGIAAFQPNIMYYIGVFVTNKRKSIEAKSGVFRIDTKKIVKPSSVSDLKTSHNSTCIHLQWSKSNDGYDRVYRIQYQPVTSDWGDRLQTIQLDNADRTTICNLVPSAVYTIKISVKPQWDGLWSEDEDTVIRLEEDVPGAPPELPPGGFVERHCSFKECRVIDVYWRPIIQRMANGEIINYRVTARDTGSLSAVTTDDTGVKTSGQLMLIEDKDYWVDVQGQTKVGLSPFRATILILAVDKKPPYPVDFLVESSPKLYQNNLYQLHITWSKPKTELDILGYTLFWCKGSTRDLDCREPMSWVVLHGDQREYSKVFSKEELSDFIFGISMETTEDSGQTISSGITWSECIYMQNERVLLPPKNVRITPHDNKVKVEWDKFKCSETRGYVSQYNVYYCPAQKGQNCTRSYNVVHVSGHDDNVDLEDLSKTVSYRIWVQAISGNGRGPDSVPVYTTATVPTDDSLTKGKLVGIVLGSLVFVVLSLIGFIFLSRKCAVEVKEQLRPYDDLPNVPLPPIPMIRPDSSRSKSPDSEEDEDIYSQIPTQNSPSTAPDSTSIYEPLISQAESQDESQERPGKLYVKLPDSTSPSTSIFARFHRGRSSMDSQESTESSFRPRPKRSSTKGLSYSADMLSGEVSPYSCVDIVQCPNSEKIPRRHVPKNKQCHSEGSMVDDPSYEKNNLSVLSNKIVTKLPMEPCTSREHFNIKLPHDKGKYDFHSDTLESCVSDDTNHGNESRRHTKDSNELPEERIPVFACSAETDESVFLPPEIYVQETWPKCSNNNEIKINNDVFLPENKTDSLPVPNVIVDHVDPTYRKELNIRTGPRPVSEVVQVPPHFYGSLSLLDSGDTTEL